METLTEPGVLPHSHHAPHPYLGGTGGSNSAAGVHAGFFSGTSLSSASSANTPPESLGSTQQNYEHFSRMPGAPTTGVTPQACFQPYPYKQQQGHNSLQPAQESALSNSIEPNYPKQKGQEYSSTRGEPNFSNYQNIGDSYSRKADAGLYSFPRSSHSEPPSSPFHNSQTAMLQGFPRHHVSPTTTAGKGAGIPDVGEENCRETVQETRQSALSPFAPDTSEGYRNSSGPDAMSARQALFSHSGKDQGLRRDLHNARCDDNDFVQPFYYEKLTNRGLGSRGITYNSNRTDGENREFNFSNKKHSSFPESVDAMTSFQPVRGSSEAEVMAYDNERYSVTDDLTIPPGEMGIKNRDRLERSASHDVQSVNWGSEMAQARDERDADGRPLRSLTLDPSLHRRHSRSGSLMFSERQEYNNYSQLHERSLDFPQQDIARERAKYFGSHDERTQPDDVLMSPAKPIRRSSDTGQIIEDPEGAAVPQQSPNRPLPPHPSPSSHMTQSNHSGHHDKQSEVMISPYLYNEGRSELEASCGPEVKRLAPSQAQENITNANTDLGPSTAQTAEMLPKESHIFMPVKQGDHVNRNISGRNLDDRDEDGDDFDGDRKTENGNDDCGGDQKPPCRPRMSQSQGHMSDSSISKVDRTPPSLDDNSNASLRDHQRERHVSRGDSTDNIREDYAEFTAKRELFSEDEDDEDSQEANSHRGRFHGSSPPLSMSPPSPDSSMTYPPPYPNPFFSPIRGLNPSMPFGSHRGGPSTGPGFPFGKDFHGRFPMPGMGGPPEMSMGGLSRVGPRRGHHSQSRFMNPMGGMEDEKDIYFCHLCSYSGKTKSDFDSHMSIHFEFNCPHCDYTSRTEGRLKRHIKDFHSDDSSRRSMPGRPKIYRCKQCPFSAKEKDKFWEHARSHIKEDKLLQCPKCSFVTEYKHHLEYHLRNHFGSKPFKCTKCNYSCVNKSMLNSHMKSHTNVYQYRCSECTYATKYCHSLKLHLKKYGHKPATVLNQDGSLPQGLDVDASGLSVATKRGPPRGPRGPRKDKSGGGGGNGGDPYLSQLFGMPPVPMGVPGMGPHTMNAMNPMLNGMMPFWPMIPGPGGLPGHAHHPHSPHHPSPPQPGMLPGMGNLARQIRLGGETGRMPPHDMDVDSVPSSAACDILSKSMNREQMGDRPHSVNSDNRSIAPKDENSDRERRGMFTSDFSNKDEFAACNLCDFVADSTRALCMHYVDVHKEEPGRDFRRDFGMISREHESFREVQMRTGPSSFRDSRSGIDRKILDGNEKDIERRRMSEPPNDILYGSGHSGNDPHRRNSLTGLLSKGNPDSRRVNTKGVEVSDGNVSAPFSAESAFPERERARGLNRCLSSLDSAQEEDLHKISSGAGDEDRGMNILHQMTLKFGDSAAIQKDIPSSTTISRSKSTVNIVSDNQSELLSRDPERSRGTRSGRGHKESPLDLTKPKSDSSSDVDNTDSPTDFRDDYDMTRTSGVDDSNEAKADEGKSLSKVTEILLKKRPYPEEAHNATQMSAQSKIADAGHTIMPRKRSRKGKAYKLDKICLKLQEQQASSPLDSDGNDSDMEMNFSTFQPLMPSVENVDEKEGKDKENTEEKKDENVKDETGNTGNENDLINDLEAGQENDGADSDGTEEYTNDEKKDDLEDFKEHTEVLNTQDSVESSDEKSLVNASDDVEKEKDETLNHFKEIENTDTSKRRKNNNENEVEEGEESDFEELQRSLKMLNGGDDSEGQQQETGTSEMKENNDACTAQKEQENESNNKNHLESTECADVTTESKLHTIKEEIHEVPHSPDQLRNMSECHSDKENSDYSHKAPFSPASSLNPCSTSFKPSLTPPENTSINRLDQCSFDSEEEIDQADLIHTVLENRKKPLPPAVRRGTELAWKLLNDPVNPVTSLPIPVTPSTSLSKIVARENAGSTSPDHQSQSNRPRASSPTASLPSTSAPANPPGTFAPCSPRPGVEMSAPSSPLRNGLRHHHPVYRQPLPYHQQQQFHNSHNHHSHPHSHSHPQYQPPQALHRNNHLLFPAHYGSSPGLNNLTNPPSTKPGSLSSTSSSSMPIPLPPTPMAFIPPTNRMERLHDQASGLGFHGGPAVTSPAKPSQASVTQKSELYECTYCDLTFRDCVMYTVHMGYHSNQNPFKCNSCGIICRDKVEFFLHIARSPHA